MSDIQATFIYNGGEVIIGGKSNEYMKDLYQKFCVKTNENYEDMVFLYDGASNPDLQISKANNNSKFNILAYNNKKTYNDTDKRAKFLICPVCKNCNKIKNCIIKMKDYKIVLDECDDDHNYGKIFLEEIGNYQLEKDHYVADYDKSYFLCKDHHDSYLYYCKTCHKNLCFECHSAHNNHQLIKFEDIAPEKGLKFDKFEKSFEDFKNDIDNLINILKKVKSNFQIYYNLSKDIKNNFNAKYRNYQIFQNAKNIEKYNSEIMKEMNKIKNQNEKDQFSSILKLYNKMTNKNSNDDDNDGSEIDISPLNTYHDPNENFSINSNSLSINNNQV